jgi:hypothetical protein
MLTGARAVGRVPAVLRPKSRPVVPRAPRQRGEREERWEEGAGERQGGRSEVGEGVGGGVIKEG